MVTAPKPHTARSCFERKHYGADPPVRGGEGRRRVGSNGYMHHVSRRGTDPSIQGKILRDNVGKVHLPAGTDNNLQRPGPIRWMPKWAGRDLDWRVSPYE